jgi:hypothetical protein
MTIGKMTTACWVVFGIMCLGFLPLILADYAIPGLPPAVHLLLAILTVGILWWGPFGYGMYLAQAGIGKGDRRLLKRGIHGTALVLKADMTGMMIGGAPEMGLSGRFAYRYHLRVTLPEGRPYETYCMICASNIQEGQTVNVAASPHNRKRVTIDVGQGKSKGKGKPDRVPQPGIRHPVIGDDRAVPQSGIRHPVIEDSILSSQRHLKDTGPKSKQNTYRGSTHDTSRSDNASRIRLLAELGKLHRDGVLTDAEFAAEKARLLGQ